jgi:hypothetical protein
MSGLDFVGISSEDFCNKEKFKFEGPEEIIRKAAAQISRSAMGNP